MHDFDGPRAEDGPTNQHKRQPCASHKVTIHLAFQILEPPPHDRRQLAKSEIAINNFPAAALGENNRKGFTARLVLVPALRPLNPSSELAWRIGHFLVVRTPQRMSVTCRFISQRARQRKRKKRWERWKNETHSNQPNMKHLHVIPSLFFANYVGDRYLAVMAANHQPNRSTTNGPSSHPLPTSRASNHSQ